MQPSICRRLGLCAVLLSCLAVPVAARAELVILKRDPGVVSSPGVDPRFSGATVSTVSIFDAGLASAGESRWWNGGQAPKGSSYTLYKFDLSSIPTGATIHLAQLQLYHTVGNGGAGNGDVSMILTHDWTEGTGNYTYPGPAGGVSYAHPNGRNTSAYQNASGGTTAPTQSWGSGSDSFFGLATDAAWPIGPSYGNAGVSYQVYDVTTHVQQWVNGAFPNYGWAQYTGYFDFHCSEAGSDFQPVLFIDYGPPTGDTLAPAAVVNLACSVPTLDSITLTWTAPGDDGAIGTAASYDIRYATSPVTDANWTDATPVTDEPVPAASGTSQNLVISGLSHSTTYYFAIKTADEVPNVSALSNIASMQTRIPDTVAPAAVTDLAAVYPASTNITLIWTAPGDNGNTGTATSYDIRYSTTAITDANWNSATQVAGEPVPAVAGTRQSMKVTGLQPDTAYYFAIKTTDHVPNVSALSNVVSVRTRVDTGDVTPPAAITNLSAGWEGATDLWLSWTAPGDDGTTGTAIAYEIRYATSPISEATWDTATPVTYAPVPAPAPAGTTQQLDVVGLTNNTTYYFAIKTADESYNWSDLSNVAVGTTWGPDVTCPSAVTDLLASNVTADAVTLTWTQTGNDWMLNLAAVNDIRYGPSPITEDSWFYHDTKVVGEPAPITPGLTQSMTINGLSAGRTYYFAMRVIDDWFNWSPLSNVVSATTLTAADTTPPAAVADLAAGKPSSGSVRLTWTAPGDDGAAGTPQAYDIRYSTSTIKSGNWASARAVADTPLPQVAGTSQAWTVYGLLPSTAYHFAIEATDEAGNRSALSNVVSATTLASVNINKPVLAQQDFEYLGAFRLPEGAFGQSNAYAFSGLAIRRVNGNVQVLTGGHRYTGDAIYECTFPGWGTQVGAWPQATMIREWGQAAYGNPSKKAVKGGNEYGWTHGLMYDPATGRFYFSFGSWYNIPPTNDPSLGWTDLSQDPPVAHGSWNSATAHCQRIRGGSLVIPDWFADAYLGGRNLGLGFGGYYSGYSACAKGTFLAAAHHPDDATPQLDTITLIDHPDDHWGTRDADYYTNASPNPVNGVGYWGFADTPVGAAIWIDLPDKHGLLYVPTMGHGNVSYFHSDVHVERQESHWWIYDPKDLAAVAQGQLQPWDPQADTWMAVYTPTPYGKFLITGCAFDPATRTLFVLVTQSYQIGGPEWHPLVHGYRIKESPVEPIWKTGDINRDGYVNVGDLQALVAAWASQAGPPPSSNWNANADINTDNFVNVGDLQLLVAHWGE